MDKESDDADLEGRVARLQMPLGNKRSRRDVSESNLF